MRASGGAAPVSGRTPASNLVPVTYHLTSALRSFAGGRDRIEVDGSPPTLSDALEALWVVCPGLRDRVMTEQGELREHVNVFVGSENARYLGGLATPLGSDPEISIFHAVSGGAVNGELRRTKDECECPEDL